MKRIIIALVAFMAVGTMGFAQGSKSLKKASKSLAKFTSDFSNTAALEEAKTLIEEAFQDEKVASSAKSWNTRGEIFYNIADAQLKQKLINPDFVITDTDGALKSYEAYTKALSMAEKKGDKKNAIKGFKGLEALLNNMGIELYNAKEYAGALANFDAELAIIDVLKANEETSRLEEGTLLTEKYYFAGLTAFYGKSYEKSIDLLKLAQETGTSDASTYQIIFESFNKLDKADEGLTYLTKGREAFPDDNGLLFSEINYYLVQGRLEEMIGNLETAIAKEPDNISVLLTLGQVYDQLQGKSVEAGDEAKAKEYFDKSLEAYSKAIALDANSFDSNYSLGALYYNKAASYTEALNEAANDFSVAGNKRYDKIKAEMQGYFDQALPYFLKSDEIRPDSKNTLIALKEIYVRKDMFDKSEIYKKRLEAMPE